LRVTSGSTTPARIAAIVALAAALGLAGCGRKSGLDTPPGAEVIPRTPDGTPQAPQRQLNIGDEDPDAKPVAAPARRKRPIPLLDWLVN
jgi:predicted small lipoprotein YifL